MDTITDLRGINRLETGLEAIQSEIKLKVPAPSFWKTDVFNFYKSMLPAIRETCDHNNAVYDKYLPKEVIVSDHIAFHLAAQMTTVNNKIKKAQDKFDTPAKKGVLNYLRHKIVKALGAEQHRAKIDKLRADIDPILWCYMLKVKDDQFILTRGTWVDKSVYEPPAQLMTFGTTRGYVTVDHVGIEPAVADATAFTRLGSDRPALNIAPLQNGLLGVTRSPLLPTPTL